MAHSLFLKAVPYQDDILALPVVSLDETADWYLQHFGLKEVERDEQASPSFVILGRDEVRIGFAMNGGDATQDGAAILVADIHAAKKELMASGLEIGDFQTDERNGEKYKAFFVVAPDGLCYYFHQKI